MTSPTREPKSVWPPIAAMGLASSSGVLDGCFRIVRASLPLCSSRRCRLASTPWGKPSFVLKTSRRVLFTSKAFRTNGAMVLLMRSFTVDG